MPISLRVADDLVDDAVLTRDDPGRAVLDMAPWTSPAQRVALLFFLAEAIGRLPRSFVIPAGQLAEQAHAFTPAAALDLIDRPELSIDEWERLIDIYLRKEP